MSQHEIARRLVDGVWRTIDVVEDGGGGGGGSTLGAARVIGPFPFAFDNAGLNDGIVFYTPVPGDFLLRAAIFIDTPWDSSINSTFCDIGTDVGGATGLFGDTGASSSGLGLTVPSLVAGGLESATPGIGEYAEFFLLGTDPLKVWVSQDGTAGGTSPGAGQGEARIYLWVATPAAP